MLKVLDSGMLRASSLSGLSTNAQLNLFAGAVIACPSDRSKLNDIVQYLAVPSSSNVPINGELSRERSNSTVLPSKNIRDLISREHEKKMNVFDCSPYKEMASQNKKIEMIVGKTLSCSAELASVAKKIREVTGSPMKFSDFSAAQQQKIIEEGPYIGGAKELSADMDTLDAHVLATLIKAEAEEYDIADMDRRKCMFNHVRSPDNPIYPWNSHRFDMGIFEVTNPIQYTEELKNLIVDRWAELLAKKENIESYLFGDMGILPVDLNEGVLDILQILSESDRKTLLINVLHINWSTERFVEDELNSRESNPRGAEFRQHTTGAKSNVVRVSDKEDKNVNKWVFEAILHGKPVTSGPSGHTLRYLNHYAMCSEMHSLSITGLKELPSLEEARLVMLANLMAPKDHHSYHEIMLASIGAYNGVDVLEYNHRGSYDDLSSTSIGSDALRRAKEELS